MTRKGFAKTAANSEENLDISFLSVLLPTNILSYSVHTEAIFLLICSGI